jgi:diaminohydroxyphosphoribosylaminopyrimidine deaminase/5-amino-6-(5-phosphoribosylamino)uracil reductase
MQPFLSQLDQHYMRRAIRIAMAVRGRVEPNPLVGCVLVKDGRIIGEGAHERFGGPHAEPTALSRVTEDPAGATAYVTLEPCCHENKKTPPCVPALIAAKIARVVVGCLDPNPEVNGNGLRQLREAGIEVDAGVCEPQCRQLLAPFSAYMTHRRPYVTMKWAQTADGKVAGPGGKRIYISNMASHRVLHELRARCDAILVGIRTVLMDDPLLTARDVQDARKLIRVVLDRDLRIPASSQLARTAAHAPVVVYCSHQTHHDRYALVAALEGNGVSVRPLALDDAGELSLPEMLKDLGRQDVAHLLVEAGPTLARSFLRTGTSDRVWIFHSPMRIDDPTAPAAEPVHYPMTGAVKIDDDLLVEHLNPTSEVYFAREASADFVRVFSGRNANSYQLD